MAFTIIPGSASAPTTYQGTDGVDVAAINSLPNGSTSVLLEAKAADDLIGWGIDLVNSTLRGGEGEDIFTPNIVEGGRLIGTFLNGNAGADTFGNPQFGIAAFSSSVVGGQGDDTFEVDNLQSSLVNGNRGDDEIYVGFGLVDTATINISNSRIRGGQDNDLISITGGQFSEVNGYINTLIAGDLGDDEILLSLGSDTLWQNSTVTGGEGDDIIDARETGNLFETARSTALVLDGGEGDDLIFASANGDFILAGNGRNEVVGGQGDDTITSGEGEDTISGGFGSDLISSGADSDEVSGGGDEDVINGEAGDDFLFGDDSFDVIDGGSDDDFIAGGADADTLTGGSGDDFFLQTEGATSELGLLKQAPTVLPTGLFFAGNSGSVLDADREGFGAGHIDGGDTITLNEGFDVITDWNNSADSLITGTSTLLEGNVTGVPNGLSYGYDLDAPGGAPNTPATLVDGNAYNIAVRGTWIEESNSFVVGDNGLGEDILVGTGTFQAGAFSFINSFNSIENWTVLDNAGNQGVNFTTAGSFPV